MDYSAATIKLVDNTGYQPTLKADYVLLGMVDDYLGRSAFFDDDMAESFYPNEKLIAQIFVRYALDALTCSQAPPIIRTTKTGHIKVVSQPLKTRIDAFYSTSIQGDPWEGRTSMKLPHSVFPAITSRQYRPDEMDPRFSYLYGAYLRYGCDEPFRFRLYNSCDRVELIKQFVAEAHAKWVSHKFTIDTAPIGHEICFEPDPILADLIHRAVREREAVRREFDN